MHGTRVERMGLMSPTGERIVKPLARHVSREFLRGEIPGAETVPTSGPVRVGDS